MPEFEAKRHWDDVYARHSPDAVSWFLAEPERSLGLIREAGLTTGAEVLDLGTGASVLVDRLMDLGYRVTALDLASRALDNSKARLGARAALVQWVVADVRTWTPAPCFDLWHDRAVFHFMAAPAAQADYLRALRAGLKQGGYLVLAAFAPDGPDHCSGLPVRRYDGPLLTRTLGPEFRLVNQTQEEHRTPWDSVQKFNYYLFRREA